MNRRSRSVELAEAEVDRTDVGLLESGKRSAGLDVAKRIASGLDVSLAEVIAEAERAWVPTSPARCLREDLARWSQRDLAVLNPSLSDSPIEGGQEASARGRLALGPRVTWTRLPLRREEIADVAVETATELLQGRQGHVLDAVLQSIERGIRDAELLRELILRDVPSEPSEARR